MSEASKERFDSLTIHEHNQADSHSVGHHRNGDHCCGILSLRANRRFSWRKSMLKTAW